MSTPIGARKCHGCVVCCIVPPVKSAEFSKTAGVPCTHCKPGHGCRIHDNRPTVCRDWLCGWRSLDFLDDRWKPDVCGLLVLPEVEDIPAYFVRRTAINFLAFRSADDLIQKFVVEMLAGLTVDQVPTFVSVPGPPDHHFTKCLVNPIIREAAQARDRGLIEQKLLEVYDTLATGEFQRVELR